MPSPCPTCPACPGHSPGELACPEPVEWAEGCSSPSQIRNFPPGYLAKKDLVIWPHFAI